MLFMDDAHLPGPASRHSHLVAAPATALDGNLWPLLGFVFLPWTTLTYVAFAPGGIVYFDWVFIGIAVLADLAMYGGGAYGNRDRLPAYAR